MKTASTTKTFELQTSVETLINAPVERVMGLLTNANDMTRWNSTLIFISGDIKVGQTIDLVSKLDPKRKFHLKIAKLTKNELVWQDGFVPMFSGVRTFSLTAQSDQETFFSMVEVFKGLMLPMIKGSLPDFEQFAKDLKKEAESR